MDIMFDGSIPAPSRKAAAIGALWPGPMCGFLPAGESRLDLTLSW